MILETGADLGCIFGGRSDISMVRFAQSQICSLLVDNEPLDNKYFY